MANGRALSTPWLAGAWRRTIQRLNLVTDIGASENPAVDNTAAIQEWLNAGTMDDDGFPLFVPYGSFRVTDKVTVLNTRCLDVTGVGTGFDWVRDHTDPELSPHLRDSTFYWDGVDGGDMFELSGISNGAIRNVNFGGKDPTDRTKTGSLVKFTEGQGFPSGDMVFERCAFL